MGWGALSCTTGVKLASAGSPASPDWGLRSARARVVVDTLAISRGSARGLALAAEVRRRDTRSSDPLDLTLIPHQLGMRFPCRGRLMLTLLWKPSLGMMKRERAGGIGPN